MTRRERLQKLPLQKRLQAMENIRLGLSDTQKFMSSLNHISLFPKSILSGLFMFYEVRQSADYWWSIQEKYFNE